MTCLLSPDENSSTCRNLNNFLSVSCPGLSWLIYYLLRLIISASLVLVHSENLILVHFASLILVLVGLLRKSDSGSLCMSVSVSLCKSDNISGFGWLCKLGSGWFFKPDLL